MSTTTTQPPRIVILGGGYAGLAVANRLARYSKQASITLIDAQACFHERIRLHQAAAGQPLQAFSYADFLAPRGIEFISATATALNADAAQLSIRRPDGSTGTFDYDYLVYALGSHSAGPGISGAAHAHTLNSPESARAIHASLAGQRNARVLVVGAGLTGIETTTELAENRPDLRITLAAGQALRPEAVPGGFSPAAVEHLRHTFDRLHIDLHEASRVTRLRAGAAVLDNGRELAFDACIWTSGFAAPPLAAAAGIQVNASGQVVTDAFLRSLSHPNIIAVGDAASAATRDGGTCRMGCATGLAMAASGARTLIALLQGRQPTPFRFVYLFRNLSLGRHDGLIQFVDRRDVPRNVVWTGAAAVRWKDYICRGTLSTIGLRAPEAPPAMPPLRMLPQLLRAPAQYA